MCGRFTLFSTYETIIERFAIAAGAIDEADFEKSYNIAPSQQVLAVINDGSQNWLGYLRWGFIPSWAKDERIGYKMINARAESLSEKRSFRNAYQNRRCLIVSDAFYEWKRTEEGKTPYCITLKSNEPFGFAGLWETWKSPDGSSVHSCTIITTDANEAVSFVHDRMPVILKQEAEQLWLNPSVHDTAILDKVLTPYNTDEMEIFEVSKEVNSPRNNSSKLIERIG
ncbi:SOS response-associated peptidase [Gracilibacillus sp. Marseille-QA3620]